MRRWKNPTEVYKVMSYERSENCTPTTSKWGTKQEGQEKMYWAFELHWQV